MCIRDRSIDDFIISYFVTGGGVKNLSIIVYTMSKRVNPSINAISTCMVLIITAALVIINLAPVLSAKRRRKEEIKKRRILPVALVAAAVSYTHLDVYKRQELPELSCVTEWIKEENRR